MNSPSSTTYNSFVKRGGKLECTYQLNAGGNIDFLTMLSCNRLASKEESKTELAQAVTAHNMDDDNTHVCPSDQVAWQDDNKVCFIHVEGKLFGDVLMNLGLHLLVEGSPISAGVSIDSIRCAKLVSGRGQGGILEAPSAYSCRHTPRQFADDEAFQMMEYLINGD